jgi:hypothetical protein
VSRVWWRSSRWPSWCWAEFPFGHGREGDLNRCEARREVRLRRDQVEAPSTRARSSRAPGSRSLEEGAVESGGVLGRPYFSRERSSVGMAEEAHGLSTANLQVDGDVLVADGSTSRGDHRRTTVPG